MPPLRGQVVLQRKIEAALNAFFRKNKAKLIKAALKANGLRKDAGDEDSDWVDVADWDSLISVVDPALSKIGQNAGRTSLASLEISDEDITNMVSEQAITYARDRSAELVGRRWEDGKLVDNPNAEYAITDGTRNMLNESIASNVEAGLSPKAIADELESNFAFSRSRAMVIARTELAFAHTEGNLSAWRESGVVSGKESILSQDHDHEDECNTNAEAGVVPIGEDFPSGDSGPPYHVNCECALVAVLSGENGEEEEGGDLEDEE